MAEAVPAKEDAGAKFPESNEPPAALAFWILPGKKSPKMTSSPSANEPSGSAWVTPIRSISARVWATMTSEPSLMG